jgi:mannose-6-phosphate isomerase-like protein (cupin superfamily)
MDAFQTSDLLARVRASGGPWLEFLRVEAMSAGLYVLGVGATDPQQPHAEDELYHVVSGRAVLRVGEEDQPVTAGSTVFVAARVAHRFHSITEELVTLVVFAPPETA